jgi:hypothetical protein
MPVFQPRKNHSTGEHQMNEILIFSIQPGENRQTKGPRYPVNFFHNNKKTEGVQIPNQLNDIIPINSTLTLKNSKEQKCSHVKTIAFEFIHKGSFGPTHLEGIWTYPFELQYRGEKYLIKIDESLAEIIPSFSRLVIIQP